MGFRNVYVRNNASLNVKNNQLVINTEDKYTLPLEDINSIMLENNESVITTYTLMKFVENKITCFVCDEKHLPTGVLLGINNYKQLKNIKMQVELSKVFQKQLWKTIIVKKIQNQANCLKFLNVEGYEKVYDFSYTVSSGDTNNVEGYAAAEYFRLLFYGTFTRRTDNKVNAALNYGYAIVRSMIARSLITHGLECAIGIFHHNQLNNFNLADDIFEPYRAIVDYYIFKNIDFDDGDDLTHDEKIKLFDLTNTLTVINNRKYNLQNAIEYTVMSLANSYKEKKDLLQLPDIIPYERYRYA